IARPVAGRAGTDRQRRRGRPGLVGGRRGRVGPAVRVVVGLDLPGSLVLDQGVVVLVARLLGGPVLVGGAPGLEGRRGGGGAFDRDRSPLELDQRDAGDAVFEQVLVDLDELLVVVARGGVLHRGRVVGGDRLHLLVVAALDRLLD